MKKLVFTFLFACIFSFAIATPSVYSVMDAAARLQELNAAIQTMPSNPYS